jgi:hypothetical protein
MGATESKASIRRNDSSTSSFGRLSYPSPRYHENSPGYIKDLSRLRQNRKAQSGLTSLVRTSSLDLGRVAEEERTFLIGGRGGSPKIRKMYVDEAASSSLYVVETLKAPPISQWLVPALVCALAYAMYNIFIKKGSTSIHPILGGVILQVVAAIVGSVLCLTLVYGPRDEEMFYDSRGIMYAIFAGVSV